MEGRGSFVGLTFQAAWAAATRGNPNALISHREAGGRQRQWAGLGLSPIICFPSNSSDHLLQLRPLLSHGYTERILRMERKQSKIRWMKNEEGVLSENNRQKERQESNKQASPEQPCFVLL